MDMEEINRRIDPRDARWTAEDCFDMTCWCARIILDVPGISKHHADRIVVEFGQLSKEMAEYIVKLHNDKLDSK